MTLDEAYEVYVANPTNDNSGLVYLEVLKYAKKLGSQRLNQKEVGTIDEPIEDAATKVWIQFHKENKFQGQSKFSTWVHRVITNDFQDWVRDRETGVGSIDDPDFKIPVDIEAVEDTNLFKKIYHREKFAQLQGTDRTIVSGLLTGFTIAQIAEKMGVSERTIHRAASRLAENS